MPAKKPIAEWKHGTHGTYVNGCRCADCRQASNAYKRELYHRKGAAQRKWERERKRVSRRSIGNPDHALIRAAEALAFYRQNAVGELRELIDEQARDDTYWLGRHPLVSFSLDEPLTGGYRL